MKFSSSLRSLRPYLAALAWGIGLTLGAVGASQAAANPPIRMAPQGVEYMCGGADKAEAGFMQMVAPRWAATLEFAVSHGPRGQFPAPVQVRVRDRYHGGVVLEATTDGPYMLARLNPGSYDVEATLGGLTITQPLNVMLGAPGRALFLWPSNFDMASVLRPTHQLAQGE